MSLEHYIQGIREGYARRIEVESKHVWKNNGILERYRLSKEFTNALRSRWIEACQKVDQDFLFLSKDGLVSLSERVACHIHAAYQEKKYKLFNWKKFFADDYCGFDNERQNDLNLFLRLKNENNPNIRVDGGFEEVDIQNINPGLLPFRWRKNNLEAATGIVEFLFSVGLARDALQEPGFIDQCADFVHKEWVKRNENCADELKKPFVFLNEEEKNKDREIVVLALEAYNQYSSKLHGTEKPEELTK